MNISRYLVVALLAIAGAAHAQSAQKYFGYYAGDYPSSNAASPGGIGFDEMHDHINLYSIFNWSGDTSPAGRAATEAYILGELAKAKAAHVHAIVFAFPFLLKPIGDGSQRQVFDPDGVAAWQHLGQSMVDRGYLLPGDPARSTVVATFLVDEPNSDTYFLWDVRGGPNPNLLSAVNAIRDTPQTARLPIATVLTSHFKGFALGMKLFDWVGFDHYGDSDSEWTATFNEMKGLAPGKKYIVVPGAKSGCKNVVVEGTGRYERALENDPDVTWMAPFTWFSGGDDGPGCKGVRDIPSLKTYYTGEGLKIKSLQCNSSVADKQFCYASPDISAALQLLLD